ncbi:MAG: hypothetical protein ACRCVU_20260 [Flavobacterium sp.]
MINPHYVCSRSALGNWSAQDIRALLNYIAELEKENASVKQELMFACQFDGYVGVEKDRYDLAIEFMDEAGRDGPSFEDEVNGLRKLIQLAMENENET